MKTNSTDEYAGCGPDSRHIHTTDETSDCDWLSNPYALDDSYSRSESIEKFRDDFEHCLGHDDEFRGAIREFVGKALGCWCQHLNDESPACHTEVIAEHADRLAEEQPAVTNGGTLGEEPQRFPAGECPENGVVAGDMVNWNFQTQATSDKCGAELKQHLVATSAEWPTNTLFHCFAVMYN